MENRRSDDGPNLREYMETRFNLLTEQIKVSDLRCEERVDSADIRYEQRFRAQMEAITKSDIASEKRFESVNEFRSTLTDQTATFIPRNEAVQRIDSINDRLNKLEVSVNEFQAKSAGGREDRVGLKSDLSMWIAIIVMMVGIATLYFKK